MGRKGSHNTTEPYQTLRLKVKWPAVTHRPAVTRRDELKCIWGGAGGFVALPLAGSGVWCRDAAVVPGRTSVGVFVFLVNYVPSIQTLGRASQ
ncbi:hypothetical protein E2C01_066334 [Portunus trituberculatus]|uniref:Uncharacterized protein n=1 Tax=Portunus trituberculatus TaxID=210409 RepID=A0A5B7HGT7_PORTR|nr:hypothetical protein [Portunus trituberculatus]